MLEVPTGERKNNRDHLHICAEGRRDQRAQCRIIEARLSCRKTICRIMLGSRMRGRRGPTKNEISPTQKSCFRYSAYLSRLLRLPPADVCMPSERSGDGRVVLDSLRLTAVSRFCGRSRKRLARYLRTDARAALARETEMYFDRVVVSTLVDRILSLFSTKIDF